MQKNFLV